MNHPLALALGCCQWTQWTTSHLSLGDPLIPAHSLLLYAGKHACNFAWGGLPTKDLNVCSCCFNPGTPSLLRRPTSSFPPTLRSPRSLEWNQITAHIFSAPPPQSAQWVSHVRDRYVARPASTSTLAVASSSASTRPAGRRGI